jgi:hypothetical protein
VRAELDALGAPYRLLDQADVLDTHVSLGPAGGLRWPGGEIDLADVAAVYVRCHDSRRVPQVAAAGPGSAPWVHATAVEDTLMCWLELTGAYVVNLPSAMAGNGSKPWQLRRAAAAGFAVPETLVTTAPDAAVRFWARHGEVVYKSVSGVRSRVARLRPADAARLADVRACPTQFQRYVPGTDVRVHAVGSQLFGTEIVCEADDYRYAAEQGHDPPELAPVMLPHDVGACCHRLAAMLHLPVAGIDLRRTPDGDWYCFEANPSPAFTYYEHATGQPIARAIACLLAAGGPVRRHARSSAAQTAADQPAAAKAAHRIEDPRKELSVRSPRLGMKSMT